MAYADRAADERHRVSSKWLQRIYGVQPKYMVINKFMMQLVGLFGKMTRELVEMNYQYNHDYNFNSDKFEKAFKVNRPIIKTGIKLMSETVYKKV